ncbi:MAG TPA: FtsX-like permease family protein, partial [Hyphomicrobiales bacterium]|nr:FtsX-like permease family protein [Hyphomicrobiales bacterium]
RQVLTESMVYALAGGVLGLLIAYPCLSLLKSFAVGYTSLASEIRMDFSILAFSVVISLAIGMLSGATAAFSRRDINSALKEGGTKATASASGTHKRQALLMVQFALSFFIITASLLILLSLYRLSNEDAGYDPARVLVVGVDLNFSNYVTNPQIRSFGMRLLEEVTALPGVESAALSGETPLQDSAFRPVPFDIEGRSASDADTRPTAKTTIVSEDYFRVMNIPLLKGRMLDYTDDENSLPVVLINENFEQLHFPDGDAVGQRVFIGATPLWRTIVGVVANVRSAELSAVEGVTYYMSFRQTPTSSLDLFVRSNRDPAELGTAITHLIHGIDPQQAVHSVKAMEAIKAEWLATPQLVAVLIGLFGLLALAITLSGVVGVVSYNISQRIREIGVHMAIGANPGDIVRMFLSQGLKVYASGLLLGLTMLLLGAPLMAPLLYATSPLSPAVYFASALVLTLAVLVAMYLPARRASGLSPVAALHFE